MTFTARVEPESMPEDGIGEERAGGRVIVRLLRRYALCRESGEAPLPALIELGGRLGVAPPAAVALASVFQITEGCLGRALIVAPGCSRRFSRDEQAVLLLMATTGAGPVHTSRAAPHGLPGVLVWAVASARRLCGDHRAERGTDGAGVGRSCPFAHAGGVVAA